MLGEQQILSDHISTYPGQAVNLHKFRPLYLHIRLIIRSVELNDYLLKTNDSELCTHSQ